WSKWPEHGDRFGEWAAEQFRAQAARGADGLKIWKPFGLHVRDQHGALVAVDDARLDPLWAAAGELNLPVLIHVADPVAFFDPRAPGRAGPPALHRPALLPALCRPHSVWDRRWP